MSTSQAEPENDGTDYDEDALRSRLPDRLTEIQKDALVTIARNPTAPKAAIARAVDTDGSTVRNAAQAFVRGNFGMHGGKGQRQTAERRDSIREAQSFDELTDKQRAAVDFAARNWEWVNEDDTTYDEILGAIEEEYGETMHRTTFYSWVFDTYRILVDLRRDEVESEDDAPDVERMGWADLLDELEAALPFDFADENLDDLPEADNDENAMSGRTRDSTGEPTEDTRDENAAAGDRDVGIEMDAEGKQQLQAAASVELPDGVRNGDVDPTERAKLIMGDMDDRIAYVEGLDNPDEVAERFADYLVAARSVIRALLVDLNDYKAQRDELTEQREELRQRLEKTRDASANLAKKVQEKDGRIRMGEADNERLRKRTQQLEIENDDLRGELTELENEFDLLEAENDDLRDRLENAESERVEKLEERNETLCERVAELKAERERLRDEKDAAMSRLSQGSETGSMQMNDRTLRSLARALNRFNDEGRSMIDYRVEANAQSAIVEAKFGDTDLTDMEDDA